MGCVISTENVQQPMQKSNQFREAELFFFFGGGAIYLYLLLLKGENELFETLLKPIRSIVLQNFTQNVCLKLNRIKSVH